MSFAYYPLSGATVSGPVIYTGNNWSFEFGLTTWTPDTASWQVGTPLPGQGGQAYHGASYGTFDAFVANVTSGTMTNDDVFAATVGAGYTATCRITPIPNSGAVAGWIGIKFLDAGNVVIGTFPGNQISGPRYQGGQAAQPEWQLSTVTAIAPASTSKVKIYIGGTNTVPQNGRVCYDWCTLQKN